MKRIFILMLFFAIQAIGGSVFTPEDIQRLRQNFFANIQTNGAIIASPSKHNPNYYYDWVRDSAIAMNLIEAWYESTHAIGYKELLFNYVSWSRMLQHQHDPNPGQDILGEPKFYINGYPYEGPWGRPQNDGPAMRASVLIHFAHQLLNDGEVAYVHSNLYNSIMDPNDMSIIKMDLEYIAHHWSEENFDLWEEVFGHHFFTAMVQQKALIEGAALARRLNDASAAIYYEQQANLINLRLHQHVDQEHQVIQASLKPHPGPQKTFELDSSIILGVLYHAHGEGEFAPNSIFVYNTVQSLHEQFNLMFPINNNHPGPILFGRYPGDTYDGYQNNRIGNPWFILTATVAEYYYTLAHNVSRANQQQIIHYIHIGDSYLKLIKKYAPNMELSEQINLNTGMQQGAHSLTWSYVAVLHALEVREKLLQHSPILNTSILGPFCERSSRKMHSNLTVCSN